ncbi:MAG TPA: hypothetical protein VI756_15500, partial [Blastocatellia bacterium]
QSYYHSCFGRLLVQRLKMAPGSNRQSPTYHRAIHPDAAETLSKIDHACYLHPVSCKRRALALGRLIGRLKYRDARRFDSLLAIEEDLI